MAKQIIICGCDECPHWIYFNGIKKCTKTGLDVDKYYRKTPSNCPLDDANITFKKVV